MAKLFCLKFFLLLFREPFPLRLIVFLLHFDMKSGNSVYVCMYVEGKTIVAGEEEEKTSIHSCYPHCSGALLFRIYFHPLTTENSDDGHLTSNCLQAGIGTWHGLGRSGCLGMQGFSFRRNTNSS